MPHCTTGFVVGLVRQFWIDSYVLSCVGQVADEYFQHRIYLKVFPMAPFPQADHCIASDPKAEQYYLACVEFIP
jgi:hypothetical protein